jgi:hypothetical protein
VEAEVVCRHVDVAQARRHVLAHHARYYCAHPHPTRPVSWHEFTRVCVCGVCVCLWRECGVSTQDTATTNTVGGGFAKGGSHPKALVGGWEAK